ncbi:hypothetical protein NC652_026685 [Populus alba x Populus x berolinensis]|nr:hypothetical protein NC652_026685 [Populus alba x Populus x berolinensis]
MAIKKIIAAFLILTLILVMVCAVDDSLTTCVNSCLPQCIETAPSSLRPKCETACLEFCTAN